MTATAEMLRTYPKAPGGTDREKLRVCIDACIECAQTCTACADACLSEDMVAELTKCIRTNLDGADVCDATGRVLSRHTGTTPTSRAQCSMRARRAAPAPTSARATRRCTSTAACVRSRAVAASRPAAT